MRYLVDTDWIIDVSGSRRGAAQVLADLHPFGIGVSIISHGELLEGAYGYHDSVERVARIYELLSRFETVPLNNEIMEIFGQNRAELRRAGQLIADLDLLIGATAIAHDLIVLTRNTRHFSRMPSLRLYQPTVDTLDGSIRGRANEPEG